MVPARAPYCEDSPDFDPDKFFEQWAKGEHTAPREDVDLYTAISKAFNIRQPDKYVYHAIASVTLGQVQQAVNAGSQHGLHAWYRDAEGKPIDPAPQADVTAYTSIFSSQTSTSKALTALASNAKKGSIRSSVATHLNEHRLLPSTLTIPKLKTAHVNPYLDFWQWSCHNLEWAGPEPDTANVRQSHHILPIFYHHFGCLCPSFEALEAIRLLGKGRPVLDIGSGNGYWTYMLRRMNITVYAIDNGDSIWRTMWIGDTIKADGAKYLTQSSYTSQGGGNGGKDAVLLLVYPQVTTAFTTAVLKAYKGSTICVAGTQNRNGFTGFKDILIDEYVLGELKDFEKIIQTPLPSFAGKDEALYVFERKKFAT